MWLKFRGSGLRDRVCVAFCSGIRIPKCTNAQERKLDDAEVCLV